MSRQNTQHETYDATHEQPQEPYAACQVVEAPPDELPYGSYHIVSMMQAIQAGRYFNVERCHISWQEPDGTMLGWKSDETTWEIEGEVPNRPTVPGIAPGPEYDAIFNNIERVMIGTWKGWVIRWGRFPCPDGTGIHGFITHSRPSHGNVPRTEISPDGVIAVWYHRPEPDLNGDDYSTNNQASPLQRLQHAPERIGED